MINFLRDITDIYDMNYWKVIWINKDGKTKSEVFAFKHEARAFYDALNVFHKRMEKLK